MVWASMRTRRCSGVTGPVWRNVDAGFDPDRYPRPMAEPATRLRLDEALEILEATPARLAAASTGVSPATLHEPLEPGGWSARDILGHLRACHQTWSAYVMRILDEDRPALRAENPRTTIHRTDFLTVPFEPSLRAFTAERASLVARLRVSTADDLARTADVRLPGLGVQRRSAFHYVHRMAEHERSHVRHIERALSASRDE